MPDRDKDMSGAFEQDRDAEKRPHATIDLKAKEVAVEEPQTDEQPKAEAKEEAADEAGAPGSENAGSEHRAEAETKTDVEAADKGALPPPAVPPRTTAGDIGRFFTHLTAGLVGGLIALVVGYYALEGFRDRLPFISDTTAGELKSAQQAIAKRLSAFEQETGGDAKQIGERINALERRLQDITKADAAGQTAAVKALSERVAQLESAPKADVTAVGEETFSSRLDPLETRFTELADKVARLEKAVSEIEARQGRSLAEAKATALAVALTNLRRTVDRGEAYQAELGAVKQLSPVKLDTATLDEHKETGVLTVDTLQKSFGKYAEEVLDVAHAPDDDSIIGKLVASARSVVRVRPTGLTEGDKPDAVIARVETRVKAGDLPAAIRESKTLKGEPAVVLRPWVEQAEARVAVDDELEQIESRLLSALENAGTPEN